MAFRIVLLRMMMWEKNESLIPDFSVIRFDCGHGIHIEKRETF